MTVRDMIEKLQAMDQDKEVMPQVVAEDGTAWNCWMELNDIPRSSLVQLKISHSELKTLKAYVATNGVDARLEALESKIDGLANILRYGHDNK